MSPQRLPAKAAALLALLAICACSDGGDETIPQVALIRPSDGSLVSGQVLLEATASDENGIATVIFLVDGDELGEDDIAPYTYDWDSTPYADNDTHTLWAAAEDHAGNRAYSEYVVVRVTTP